MALLAGKLSPAEYHEVTKTWQLRDLLVWMEECRVQGAFDDLKETESFSNPTPGR